MSLYLWPKLIGGPNDGESVDVAESGGGRGWIMVDKPTGGHELYWPRRISVGQDTRHPMASMRAAHTLVAFVHADIGPRDGLEDLMRTLFENAGCEVIPEPDPEGAEA